MSATIREHLDASFRSLMKVAIAAWIGMVAAVVLATTVVTSPYVAAAIMIVGAAVFFPTVLRLQFGGLRCPACGVNLFGLCWYPKMKLSLSIPKEFHFCPGCGKSLEERCEQSVIGEGTTNRASGPPSADAPVGRSS